MLFSILTIRDRHRLEKMSHSSLVIPYMNFFKLCGFVASTGTSLTWYLSKML